jgi:uncharacterized protein (UPF0276 family)
MITTSNLGYGLGLRSQHWDDVLIQQPTDVEWFEIISENFMHNKGYPQEVLSKIRESYPVAMHGVSLSIGSVDPLNRDYLASLKALADWLEPAWISDHICWTGINHINTHDLLPVPYTEDSLRQMVNKVDEVQTYLGRRILLENPSNYMEFSANTLSEWDFIRQLLEQADCMLLLDINNIYVTCFNHKLDPKTYIDSIPADRIGQIHLAGHENHDTHIIDTHDCHINEEVLALYAYAMRTKGQKSTMIEWDSNIPSFETMIMELKRVRLFSETENLPNFSPQKNTKSTTTEPDMAYNELMHLFQSCVLNNVKPQNWVNDKEDFPAVDQLAVYRFAYRKRLFNAVVEEYPQSRSALGIDRFDLLVRTYIEHNPSTFYSLDPYIKGFANFLKHHSPEQAEVASTESIISELRDQPQPATITLAALAEAGADEFLSLNLSFTPAAKLTSSLLLICKKLQVYRQPLTQLEYAGLQAINATESLEEAMQYLYQEDFCTAETALPTIQTLLSEFVPKGVFTLRQIENMTV